MADEQYVTKISKEDDYHITFQTHKGHQNDIHYIGIFVDTAVSEITKYQLNVAISYILWLLSCLSKL